MKLSVGTALRQLLAVSVLGAAAVASIASGHTAEDRCGPAGETDPPDGVAVCITPAPSLSPTTPLVTIPPTSQPTGQPTGTVPPDDTRLAPPENFEVAEVRERAFLVTWTWPAGQSLDPTFFRVNNMGEATDVPFDGPGEYEVEVAAVCGSGNNFLTLDAFNTEVDPEASSQAENVIEVEPDCG